MLLETKFYLKPQKPQISDYLIDIKISSTLRKKEVQNSLNSNVLHLSQANSDSYCNNRYKPDIYSSRYYLNHLN